MSSPPVLSVRGLSKEYRLGTISYGSLTKDLQSWWALRRGLEDPNARVSEHLGDSTAVSMPEESGRFLALDDVSFDVADGEMLGIVGRNGAGKSTLLKILSRLTLPTTGEVKIRGHLSSLLEVGTGFHPELTGRDNIFLNGAILGMRRPEVLAKLDEIVEFAEIGKFLDTPVKRYSSGMYVRLAFAVAAHLEPDILVLDEVLAVGDAKFVQKCMGKMGEVAREGRAVVFVSHSMSSVLQLCHTCLMLEGGRMVAYGNPLDVTSKYLGVDTQASTPAEKVWSAADAPSIGSTVRLSRVAVGGIDGAMRTVFDVKEDVVITIEFAVLEPKWAMNAHVYLRTALGEKILVSMDNLALPDPEATRMPGAYIERCTIAAPFLNEGNYTVEVVVCSHPGARFNLSVADALAFRITDDMKPEGVRGNWSREWPLYPIRPRLGWTIEHRAAGPEAN